MRQTGSGRALGQASRAFTLIEMLVVMGILGLLMAMAFSGVGAARSQARIAKANVEIRELLRAWLTYEAAYDDWPAEAPPDSNEIEASAENLAELLGDNSQKIVYLNAEMTGSAFCDPWGTPYRFRILKQNTGNESEETFGAAITFPNRNREVQR